MTWPSPAYPDYGYQLDFKLVPKLYPTISLWDHRSWITVTLFSGQLHCTLIAARCSLFGHCRTLIEIIWSPYVRLVSIIFYIIYRLYRLHLANRVYINAKKLKKLVFQIPQLLFKGLLGRRRGYLIIILSRFLSRPLIILSHPLIILSHPLIILSHKIIRLFEGF